MVVLRGGIHCYCACCMDRRLGLQNSCTSRAVGMRGACWVASLHGRNQCIRVLVRIGSGAMRLGCMLSMLWTRKDVCKQLYARICGKYQAVLPPSVRFMCRLLPKLCNAYRSPLPARSRQHWWV